MAGRREYPIGGGRAPPAIVRTRAQGPRFAQWAAGGGWRYSPLMSYASDIPQAQSPNVVL